VGHVLKLRFFAHLGEGLRCHSVSGDVPPAFGVLVRAWVESGQTHERDFKIEARSIRVALDALHDLCSRKAATKRLFKAMTDAELRAHYGRQEAEASLSPGKMGEYAHHPHLQMAHSKSSAHSSG